MLSEEEMAKGFQYAARFLYDRELFTFRGILTFLLQLLGLFAVLITIRLLLRPPTVTVRNPDSVACIDLRAFEEYFQTVKMVVPARLMQNLARLADSTHPFRVATILCWDHPPRTRPRVDVTTFKANPQLVPPLTMDKILAHLREELSAADRPPRWSIPTDSSPGIFVASLYQVGTEERPLELFDLLRPLAKDSPRYLRDAWREHTARDSTAAAIIHAIDSSGLNPVETKIALEALRGSAWVINRIVVQNTSTHAVADKTNVAIDHTGNGIIEFMGGTIEFERRQQTFSARVDRLLPREERWAVLRSAWWRVADSEIRVLSDPAPVFDPQLARRFATSLGIFGLVYVVFNLLLRLPRFSHLIPPAP